MDVNSRLENSSLAIVQAIALTDRAGRDVALTVARLTYAVDPAGKVKLDAAPVRWGEARDAAGVFRPSDAVVDKPGTDVGLVGTAHPPPRGASALAWIDVGGVRKVVRIVGERTYERAWRGITPSAPGPLRPTPLRYELAFGGAEVAPDGTPHEVAENPVGVGFALDPERLVGGPAPRLEPAEDGGSEVDRATACFAPVPVSWEPRRGLAGTFDDAWARTRAPLPPADASPRANHWSARGLHSDAPLTPDVPVEVGGVLAETVWRFRLPAYAIRFAAVVDGVRADLPTHLDGFLIDADAGLVELTFRAVVRLPRPWDRLDKLAVWGVGPMGPGVVGATQA